MKYNYGDIVNYKYTNRYKGLSLDKAELVDYEDKEAILTGAIRYISSDNVYDISLGIPNRRDYIRDAYNIKEGDIIGKVQT